MQELQSTHSATGAHAEVDEALRGLGYDGFRPGQREAVLALLQARRLLLVAPTGGGKSLCYQLPATMLAGTTVVISPLIALMQDQVAALAKRGVAATFLASTLGQDEARGRMRDLARGAFKLVYVAPERLMFEGFRGLLKDLDVPLIAVDEAHCISEWGHDFRPEYMKIGELLADFAHTRVLACTATATPVVRDEILGRLRLPADTPQIVRGFARPNLALCVRDTQTGKQRNALCEEMLHKALKGPAHGAGTAIIYAPTRKATEEQQARLRKLGWRAGAYHAGLPPTQRAQSQDAFIEGKLDLVVATNAFGMGIDRSDVRAVIHLAPPGSIEAYYQEVGRAGRDGAPAWGLLLTSPSDMPLRRSLLERGSPGSPPPAAAVIEHKWSMFLELMRWAEGGSCRHDAILRYFGDEQETLAGCGQCDVCAALTQGDNENDAAATTLVVRQALSGVARIHGRFGLGMAVQLLRGTKEPRLLRAGLTSVKTFGILQDRPEPWLLALLRRCVTAGWVDFTGGERPVAVLTADGNAVMKSDKPVRLLLPSTGHAAAFSGGNKPKAPRGAASHTDEAQLDPAATQLFEALRAHRLQVSQKESVPPYVVASDRTLRDLARLRPRNMEELKLVHGIGDNKAERFGAGLLRVVAKSDARKSE